METKKQVSYRLSETTIRELAEIAKRNNVTTTDVITVLAHLYATGNDFDTADEWFNIVRIS